MSPSWNPESRAERLVAGSRVALACFSIIASHIDPFLEGSTPIDLLLLTFAAYACSVALVSWNRPTPSLAVRIATHAIDLAFFAALVYFVEGIASPFFLYFTFALFAAMLRFPPRGIFWTAAASLALFWAIGLSLSLGDFSTFAWNRALMRSVFLIVTALILIRLAEYQASIQKDLREIASWPRPRSSDVATVAADLMERTCRILRVSKAMLVWVHGPQKNVFVGEFRGEEFILREDDTRYFEALVADDAQSATYILRDGALHPVIDEEDALAAHEIHEPTFAVRFHGETVRGRILLIGRRDLSEEDSVLARIVARLIADRLDQHHLTDRLKLAAAMEARARVGRDLHDSLLQSLTGVALQLHTLHRLMEKNIEEARQRVKDIQGVISGDQRELRRFIDRLQSEESYRPPDFFLPQRIATAASRYSQQWDLAVNTDIDPAVQFISESLRHEVFSVVSEALANAARHAAASEVRLQLNVADDSVNIHVVDNGKGFPFSGTFNLQELVDLKRGPVTLRERIASLGGDLVIDSSDRGAKLEIRIPVV